MRMIGDAALALAMIAALLLFLSGAKLLVRGEDRKRGVLMVLAAMVLLANVLIWTL
ncbi:MAG: hypothetical protein ABIN83_02570 [Sphingomicrobium sp.]